MAKAKGSKGCSTGKFTDRGNRAICESSVNNAVDAVVARLNTKPSLIKVDPLPIGETNPVRIFGSLTRRNREGQLLQVHLNESLTEGRDTGDGQCYADTFALERPGRHESTHRKDAANCKAVVESSIAEMNRCVTARFQIDGVVFPVERGLMQYYQKRLDELRARQ
jgi:hypothetical protein